MVGPQRAALAFDAPPLNPRGQPPASWKVNDGARNKNKKRTSNNSSRSSSCSGGNGQWAL